MADYIYLGPTSTQHGLENGKVFKGSVPASIANLAERVPAVRYLVVNISDRSLIIQELKRTGSAADIYYKSIADGTAFIGLGGGGVVTPPVTPVPDYQKPSYTTPIPSTLYTTDGKKVNPADFYGPNGLIVDMSGIGTGAIKEIDFANAVTTAGNKQYTDAGEKKLTITISKSTDATDATFTFWFVKDGIKLPTQGFRVTGEQDLVSVGKPREIISITKPPGVALELQWTAPTGGGNVSAKASVI